LWRDAYYIAPMTTTATQNAAANFLDVIDAKTKAEILNNIANHYGITAEEAFAEVTDSEAEHLLDYVTGPARARHERADATPRTQVSAADYKANRKRLGTQAKVAAQLGVARSTVARREVGKMPITTEAALAILMLWLVRTTTKLT
jgi:DNA-binding XRE family transcriptional regulator